MNILTNETFNFCFFSIGIIFSVGFYVALIGHTSDKEKMTFFGGFIAFIISPILLFILAMSVWVKWVIHLI